MGEELKKTSRSVVVELTKTLRSVVEELTEILRSMVEELMNWSSIQLELLVVVVVVVGHSTWERPLLLEPQELLQTGTPTVVHC